MIDFLKKLIGRKPQDVALDAIELADWLEEISEDALSDVNRMLRNALEKAEDAKDELKAKLQALENAELMNAEIPEREKHIMEGNRTNYLRRTNSFIESAVIPDFHYNKIEEFCAYFGRELEKFNSETAKGYYILTNFFDSEMKEIATSLKALETSATELSGHASSGKLPEYKELFAKIRELNEALVKEEQIAKELGVLEDELKSSMNKKTMLQERMVAIKESPVYKEFYTEEKRKDKIEDSMKQLDSKLNAAIKAIDKQLKKVAYDEKVDISDYLESPLKALENDSGSKMLSLIVKLRTVDFPDLKDKEKEKLAKSLSTITGDFLESILAENETLKKEKEEVMSTLERSSMIMDLKELDYQMEHTNEKIKRLEADIAFKTSAREALKIENKANRLEIALTDFTGDNVKINLGQDL